jgi:hypothetical protein
MLIDQLDLPEEVLAARESENLVIFAGGGVSFPPPSSLPLFDGLVDLIEKEANQSTSQGLDFDQRLGELCTKAATWKGWTCASS